MMPRRLVLDTNVLVSALLLRSAGARWLRDAWQTGLLNPMANRVTVTELLHVLAYPKFALAQSDQEELLADYLPWCEIVTMPDELPKVPQCRDVRDQPFLELAVVAGVSGLITGDKDLLALRDQFPIPILTVAELRDELSAEGCQT